jgi:branched-chain amino acid transport system permease protein
VNFLQQLVNGIQIGSIYALIAIGYTMVYGVLRLINFAHGDVYMVGAMMGVFAARALGVNRDTPLATNVLVLAISVIGCALLGLAIERLAYRRLRSAPRLTALITAIGISLLLEYVVQAWVGAKPHFYPDTPLSGRTLSLGGVTLSYGGLLVLVVSALLMAGLWYIVMRTRVGKAMRAVSHDREAAALMGIDSDRIIGFTFALGSGLAGAAGVMVAGLTNTQVSPLIGLLPGLKAFVAAVLGGIGNIPGAMLGGLLLGTAETFASAKYPQLRDAVAFVILILVLLVRPAGLLGSVRPEKV